MYARLLITGLAALLALQPGCRKAAEEAVEKRVEKESGAASVDITEEGIEIRGKEGSMRVRAGGKVAVPDSFPEDVPLYQGVRIDAAQEMAGKGTTLIMHAPASIDEVTSFHLEQMGRRGWKTVVQTRMEEQVFATFKKDERTVTLSVGSDDEGTLVSMTHVPAG